MSQENYIAKLLEMEEAIIENVEKADRFTYINFHLPVREAVCSRCGALTHRIHDCRVKILRDLPVQEKGSPATIMVKKSSRNHLRATMKYASSEASKMGHTVGDALEHLS